MIRIRTTLLLGFLAALLLGFPGTASAVPGNGVDWTVTTAANGYGTGRSNFGYALSPGSRATDGLVVTNRGSTPLRLGVYAADAFTTKAGKLDLLTPDRTSTSVGAWVRAGRGTVTVAPGTSATVPFTLTVPADAAPGDHLGGIVTSQTQDGLDRRVGLRIRVRVGGHLEPRLSVRDLAVDYAGTANPLGTGAARLTYTIRNTGNAVLAARQSVSLTGPFGRARVTAGTVPDSPALLPGESWRVSVPLREVTPALRLTAKVTLVPLLTDAAGSTQPLARVSTTTHAWALPWTLLVLVVLLLVLLGLAVRSVVRRSR